ncbi:MAG: Ig-like domain-containing protein [Gammaproteobacteria bacterium]|nr:Ig-like domain-containing protein [Gammaproteobacteria bacterium]
MVDAKDKAGDAAATMNLVYDVDATDPTVGGVTPASSTYIDQSTQLVVTFSETMDPGSLTIGGTMSSQASAGWSQTAVPNDTLTLSAATPWAEGLNRTLSLDVNDGVGHPISTQNLIYNVDIGAPTVSVSPVNGSVIAANTPIVLTFSESMNTTPTLGGTLSTTSYTWGTTTNSNDTLTISPTTTWASGSGKTLIVEANDLAGFSAPTQSLTFHVLDSSVYVHSSGSDANPGTSDLPKATIQAGIDTAAAAYSTATVKVAGGTYTIAPQVGTSIVTTGGTTITLAPGIRVEGGYDPANWTTARDAATYTTTLSPTDQEGYVVLADGASITRTSVLTGFVFAGDQSIYSSDCGGGVLIRNGASPEISSNIFSLSKGGCGIKGVSIANGGNPLIKQNAFTGPGDTISRVWGIYVQNASPEITSNTITLYQADSKKIGIAILDDTIAQSEASIIAFNTITATGGVYLSATATTSTASLSANTISYGGTLGVSCLYATCSIEGNHLNGPGGSGISTMSSSSVIVNNVVTITGAGQAVRLSGTSSPIVRNNTLHTFGGGIGFVSGATPYIDNNIIVVTAATGSNNAIFQGSTDVPLSIRNNVLFADYAYVSGRDLGCGRFGGGYDYCLIADLENSVGPFAGLISPLPSGNINVDPVLESPSGVDGDLTTMDDNNFHLSVTTPVSVYQGGLNGADLGWSFTTDYDSVIRPASGSSWAMGAYEP